MTPPSKPSPSAVAKAGFFKGLRTAAMLLKIMLPIFVVVCFLKHTPVMDKISEWLSPVMSIFHLPAEAAVPIIAGAFGDEYSVVAAMGSFDFSQAAVTTICMIALAFHSMPVEAAVTTKIGYSVWRSFIFRLILAILTGIACGFLTGWWV